MGAPKEGAWITPTEPSKDNQRDTVIDIPRDGVKDTAWGPTTTDTPWHAVKDPPKDPTMETPTDPTTHTLRVGTRVTPKDPTPRDGDTPWDELRVTPMDNDTPWDPTGATPKHRDPQRDPTRTTPMLRATPMDNDTPWDPTGATPRRRDPPTPPPSPPPRTWLGSSPQLWERFPPAADFVCLQEVFDPVAEALLCRQLKLRYPHVLHGVGAGGLRAGGLKVLGSGLLVASRYPVMAASFYCYPNGAGEDALAAKGLLCIQVSLGHVSGCRLLGYVSCTHLQAPERDAAIRNEQLRLALLWVQHFQEMHSNRGDVVGFDVLCGDLNFDNCSRGTLLDYLKIYDDPINSPEKMRR
uniref:sphingomyelin phosphodiesterase n=1 Tax=Phasianus colchicus TaxID=9054 RepID=A0A669Q5L9_PHACC